MKKIEIKINIHFQKGKHKIEVETDTTPSPQPPLKRPKKKDSTKNTKSKRNVKTNDFAPSREGCTEVVSSEKCEVPSDENDIEVKNMEAWDFVQLPKSLLLGLSEQGFTKPTQIQYLTLPPAIMGKNFKLLGIKPKINYLDTIKIIMKGLKLNI